LAGEDDSGFPDLARLNSLRAKNNHHLSGMLSVSSVYLGGLNEVTYKKFGDILKHFKTEELAKAHAEACLEEEINN
jgi:hypothetical protein